MADKFYRLKIRKSTEEQMMIYARLKRLRFETPAMQRKIRQLIDEVGGNDYCEGLYQFLTTDMTPAQYSMRFYASPKKLCDMRREVYKRWPR